MTTKQAWMQRQPNTKKVRLLEKNFYGKGEVKGKRFEQIKASEHAYVYQVGSGTIYYEVFERITRPVMISFKPPVFSETEEYEVYPTSNNFGEWAWTYSKLENALNRFNEINEKFSQ